MRAKPARRESPIACVLFSSAAYIVATPSGMMIASAAPTSSPIPRTWMPERALLESVDLSMSGSAPTRRLAANMAAHWPRSARMGMVL
jgi:hypothetical protein